VLTIVSTDLDGVHAMCANCFRLVHDNGNEHDDRAETESESELKELREQDRAGDCSEHVGQCLGVLLDDVVELLDDNSNHGASDARH